MEVKTSAYCFCFSLELPLFTTVILRDKKMDFSEQNIIKLAKHIGQGIKAAHDKGFIHRDIKPANLFVSDDGMYKLGDFNVSKKNTTARSVTGSDGYMAPEVFRFNSDNSYTRQADIYSFGICLYQFMNNFYFPFEEKGKVYTDTAIDRRMRGECFPKPENSSEEFGRIILRACEFDTSKRYQTIGEMLTDLENLNSSCPDEAYISTETSALHDDNATQYAGEDISVKDTNATQYAGEYYQEENNITPVCEEAESECYTYDESEDISETESDNESYSDEFETDLYETNESDFEIEDGVLIKYRGNAEYVKIPYGVTKIGEDAFIWCKNLTSVMIPDSVTEIGDSAFYSCDSLTSVIIPDSVTKIGDEAFSRCESLASITIPESVTKIVFSAFRDCESLVSIQVAENNSNYTSVNGVLFNKDRSELIKYPAEKVEDNYIIPRYVKEIKSDAFAFCENLTSVTIPNSVTEIKLHAFYSCKSLTSIIIPSSVTEINESAFKYCDSLISIQVAENNLNYTSVNGVLFSKDMSKLIKYPVGKVEDNYIIPDIVTKIGFYAFENCDNLTSVTIPNSVTKIDGKAFDCCKNLTSVTIPRRFENDIDRIFTDCPKIAITYTEPEEEKPEKTSGKLKKILGKMFGNKDL